MEKLTPSYGFIRKIGGRLDGDPRNKAEKKSEADGLESAGVPPSPSSSRSSLARGSRTCFFTTPTWTARAGTEDLRVGWRCTSRAARTGRDGKPTATRVSLAPEERARALRARGEGGVGGGGAAAAPATGADAELGQGGAFLEIRPTRRRRLPTFLSSFAEDLSLELGVVTIMKASYGFIKCCARREDLFFHFTEVIGGEAAVSVGQDVTFRVRHPAAGGGRGAGGRTSPWRSASRAAPKRQRGVRDGRAETLRRGVCVERLVFGRAGGFGARGGDDRGGAPGALEYALRDGDRRVRV